jgi:hypothetical protein
MRINVFHNHEEQIIHYLHKRFIARLSKVIFHLHNCNEENTLILASAANKFQDLVWFDE